MSPVPTVISRQLSIFIIILCCWLVSATSRAGIFFVYWDWQYGLPVVLALVCVFVSLVRLYILDGTGTLIYAIISMTLITYLDYILRDSDLYKLTSSYIILFSLIAIIVSSLTVFIGGTRSQNNLSLFICWTIFTAAVLWIGIAHMSHRANAMIGVDYLLLIAASFCAAEGLRQYRQWHLREVAVTDVN